VCREEINEDMTCRAEWFEAHWCAADVLGAPGAWLYDSRWRTLTVRGVHDVVVTDESVTIPGLDEAGRMQTIDGLVGELEIQVWCYRVNYLAEILE